MIRSTGTLTSARASQYLQQLCKHFAHKTEVVFDAHQGQIALRTGPVSLAATADQLIATVTAPDLETLPQARHVIDKHLAIFAHREGFETLDWQAPVQA
jgi:hypothetical protein